MFKNKKFIFISLEVLVAVTSVSVFSMLNPANILAITKAKEEYVSTTNSALSLYGTTTYLKTENGNSIKCETNGSVAIGNVIVLGYGQYLKNIDPLNKIESIEVTYTGDQLLFLGLNTEVDIYGDNDGFYDRIYSGFARNIGRKPYFALKSMGTTYIKKIVITYYCDIETSRPMPSLDFDEDIMYNPNTLYNIEIQTSDHVYINIDDNIKKAKAHDIINFSYSLDPGYSLYGISVYQKSNKLPVVYDAIDQTANEIDMVHDDIVIEAKACQYGNTKRTYSEIPSDSHFRNGFSYWNTDNLHPVKEGTMTYNGTAETSGTEQQTGGSTAYWNFCQWWCSHDIKNSAYSYIDGYHVYADPTRRLAINTTSSEFNFDLNAAAIFDSEYGEGIIKSGNWPHILLEQTCTPSSLQYVSDIMNEGKDLKLKGDFAVTWNDKKFHDKRMVADCAQLNWYVKLTYKTRPGQSKPSGLDSITYMWVGFPIYDDRYLDGTPLYMAADKGQPGATGAFICNLPSRDIIGERFQLNKMYCLDFVISEKLQYAYTNAKQRGYLVGTNWEDMVVDYMNVGWEIYSGRVINSSIRNMNLYIS